MVFFVETIIFAAVIQKYNDKYMKKLVWFAAAGMMSLAACQENAGYTIKGTAEGATDGDMVYLQNRTDGGFVALDSAVVKNGEFEFTGTPDSVPAVRYVTYMKGDNRAAAMLFVEPGTVTVYLNPEENRVSGTVNNDALQTFMDEFSRIGKEMDGIYKKATTDSTLTAAQKDSLMKVLEEKEEAGSAHILQTISDNIDKAAGVELLCMFGSSFEVADVQPLLAKVPAQLASQPNFVRLKGYVETLAKTSEGQKFIDFALNTPEGKEVKLSDYISKNKYTLVDFWASWCGPCRMEMPNVVAAYAKYKAKGFGVVGVSLDSNLESWKKGISDLKITWPQMSDLKGWQCEAAKLYGVRSIPATVLVAQDGTIVARDLRGEDIAAKLAELLK